MPVLRQPRPRRPHRLPPSSHLFALLIVAALLLAACGTAEQTPPAATAGRTITVTGTGRIDAQPDLNRLLFGYWVKDEDANTAIDNSAARLAEITAALIALGIDPADITAPGAAMNSEQIFGLDGYPTERLLHAVNQNVTVTVRDASLLGDVLNSVRITAGAPYIYSLNVEPQFSPQRWERLLAEAQSLALADAQTEAQSLASQLGLSLAEPLAVTVLSRDAYTGPLLQAQVTVEVSYSLQAGDLAQD
jgi:uncharacterized protein